MTTPTIGQTMIAARPMTQSIAFKTSGTTES
jgi:hypothetical protein